MGTVQHAAAVRQGLEADGFAADARSVRRLPQARSLLCGLALAVLACAAPLAALGCGGGGGGGGASASAATVPSAQPLPQGTIEVLTYNVAGLPEPLSSSLPATYTRQISPLLNPYDLVLVQEDFWYHQDLASSVTHIYRSIPQPGPISGGSRLVNDGLNHFAHVTIGPVDRAAWQTCHGLWNAAFDCLGSKGFTHAVLTLAPGVEVDVYNLHMDAGGSYGDIFARQQQVVQLRDRVLAISHGRAVIMAGDFNLHGFDPDDEPLLQQLLTSLGLSDTCRTLQCNDERIDRVLFRSSAMVELRPLAWRIATEFVDPQGNDLSDHPAIHATLGWSALVP